MKKIVSLLIVIAMLVGMVPAVVVGADEITGTKYTETTLTSGTYILVDANGYAPTVLDGGWILSAVATVSGDTASGVSTWTLIVDGSNVKLCDANGSYVAPKGGNTNGIIAAEYSWTWTCNDDGTYSFAGQGDDTVMLAGNTGSENKYRGYKVSTVTGSYAENYPSAFTLYKVSDSTETPEQPEEPEEPEADTELTIPEANELGASKSHNAYTSGKYYVTGVITSVVNTTYGNVYIEDAQGNSLYVYGLYNSDGSVRYDAMDAQPQVGDVITVYGTIGQFRDVPQMKDAWVVKIAPMFVVDEVTAYAGGTVDVTIAVKHNPGIASIKLLVTYDSALTLDSVVYNNEIGGMFMAPQKMNSPVTLNWFNGIANSFGDWVFATLTFTVDEDAAFGEYPITITYDPNDVYDITETNIEFAIQNGGVTVVCPHTNKQYVEAVDTGCETEGCMEHYTCPDCGAYLAADGVTELAGPPIMAPLGHVEEESVEVIQEPGCETKGTQKITVFCHNCEEVLSEEYLPIEPTGHDYQAVVTDPTCEDQGYTTHTCANCGDSYVDTYVDANGHSYGEWFETAAPGCETKGTERRNCANCDAYETRDVAATGHTHGTAVRENEVAPTCDVDGHYDEVVYCTECDAELSRTEKVLAATGHDYEATVTAPTCTEQGYTTHTCSKCGDTYKDSYVDANGHSYGQWYETKAPGCETKGTEQRDCSVCDAYETRDVAAVGHTHGTPVREKVVEATCEEDGHYDEVVYCTECKKELSRTEKVLAATGHDYESVVTAPTCTAKGYTTHTCAKCGDTYKDSYVDANGHDYKAVVTAPTCTEKGFTTYTCSVCGDHYVSDYVDATGHDWDEGIVVKEPTEEEEGLCEQTCRNCGEKRTVSIPTLDHVHDYKAVVTAPTCTEQGYTTYTCRCGHEYTADFVDALGHSYDAVVTAPTCTEQGYTTYTCSVCGHTYKDDYVDALGHTRGEVIRENVVEATCEVDGSCDEVTYCTECGKEQSRIHKVLPAVGHNYETVVTAPTCTENGYTTYTCSVCGESYDSDYVDATGHTWDEGTYTAPTCGKDGYTVYHCACGETKTETHAGTALEHSYDDDGYCVHCGQSSDAPQFALGDVNMDGQVDTTDAYYIVLYYNEIMELTDEQIQLADVDGNGEVDTTDAYYIVLYYNEIIDVFPAEQ